MTIATATSAGRSHVSPLAAAWSGFVGFCVFVADVLHEARELEREAHERMPFIAW